MDVPIPSYLEKEFVVEDNFAVVRNPRNLEQSSRFQAGDVLPPGKRIGDRKIIPMMTRVRITGLRTDEHRNAFALAEPVGAGPAVPGGWTRVTNFAGGMLN